MVLGLVAAIIFYCIAGLETLAESVFERTIEKDFTEIGIKT